MKALPSELEAKIDEIRSWMLNGDQAEVAARSGRDEPWVSRVLNKKLPPDEKIITAAIQVMEENKVRFGITPKMKISA